MADRLISADALIEYANCEITSPFAYPQGQKTEDEKAYREKWEFVRNVVMCAPTAEAEPNSCEYWDGESHFCALRTTSGKAQRAYDEMLRRAIEALKAEQMESDVYCDRNLCAQNEYNGIECDECQEKRKESEG